MSLTNAAEVIEPISVEDSIRQAMEEVEGQENTDSEGDNDGVASDKQPDRTRSEDGKFAKKAEEKEEKAGEEKPAQTSETSQEKQQPVAAVDTAPQSWGVAVKAKWNELPAEVRAEINKREGDIHQMMTRHDGELRLGRDMKDVITPYMPIITAEGGNPVAAVQSLLNTAYLLRTGQPAQKAQLLQQIAQQYGVDMGQAQNMPQVDPALSQVMDRLQGIEQRFTQQSTLQEQQEQAKIQSEIQAFAANPKNANFEQVKAAMAPLLGSGQAKDLQEAYDMACWSNPAIRSTLIAAQQAEEAEKRKAEIARKKQAAVSVTGSPGVKPPSSTIQSNRSVEDDLRDAFDEVLGSKI